MIKIIKDLDITASGVVYLTASGNLSIYNKEKWMGLVPYIP